jgi:fucose 4-O-acetylase-like acetyltransferase
MEAIVSKLNVDKIDRDYSIDFTKGILVLAMIIYHSLNYSKTNSLFDNYLHFIGSGFIFMAGFLITNINRDKYKQETRTLYTKLILRGLKLAALFTILNILINLAVKQNYGDRLMGINIFIENAFSIFIKGNGKIAAFEILLSIGYLFLLSPLLLLGINKTKYFILIIAIVLTLICVVMPAFNIYS